MLGASKHTFRKEHGGTRSHYLEIANSSKLYINVSVRDVADVEDVDEEDGVAEPTVNHTDCPSHGNQSDESKNK